MKTLICLLSEQPVPNLISCRALNPDTILLVKTQKMAKACQNFQDALVLFNVQAHVEEVSVPPDMDNHFPGLKKLFQEKLLDAYSGSEFEVNLTGGLKPMSIALYDVFRSVPNTNLYYIDVKQSQRILDFSMGTPAMPDCKQLPLDVFLAGYGFEFENFDQVQKSESVARERVDLTRSLALHCKELNVWNKEILASKELEEEFEKLKKWRKKVMKEGNEEKKFSVPLGYFKLSPTAAAQKIAEHFNLELLPNGSLAGELKGADVRYLDGGWLEEFIWTTLHSQADKFQIEDLHLGLKIREKNLENPGNSNEASNELDISFMRNNRFHIIECKTGVQEKMQEILYKLFAISKNLKALQVQKYLIANAQNINEPHVVKRANAYDIKCRNADQIRALAEDPDTELPNLLK